MDLKNKNVIYIGGCGGIGTAICKHLALKNVAELAELNPSTEVIFVKLNIQNMEEVVKCFEELFVKLKRIDILFNGSGVFNEFDPDNTIGVNLLGAILCTMEFLKNSKFQRGGMVVNIASAGGLEPYPPTAIYCATKSGLISYSRAMAGEINFNQYGISFICICPGMTQTSLIDKFSSVELTQYSSEIKKTFSGIKAQTCDQLALNVIKAVEENKNGAVYLCQNGKRKEVLSFIGPEIFAE